ncbi:SusC/RagA family TonB-linked outer membrane protein [Mucilaginibacter sp. Bleaf8]|uniref:SusC/RagA family TonB-linked outer membrane protein n=1 Tax=Mucilaginibacter sp. Bleaf8 TaxID=2834430 RepID=UPI001BCF5214|nr:SusC/RagA family TonB-linked outer membrane protein [Mucilaginibacter sp. Bleaf8]MBS7567004.1 SusC/RagA family TonB-linked outer membrane protein [Mucilaginibacter sp. Bleaf8]
MRLIRILLFFLLFQIAHKACSQTTVTLNQQTTSFEPLIEAIKKQTIYRFVYDPEHLPKNQINIQARNQEATSLLDQLLSGTEFTYTLLANHLIVISMRNEKVGRTLITGTITDQLGRALENVSVHVKGKTFTTASDSAGKYSINISPSQTLLFTHVGFTTRQLRPAPDSRQLNVILLPDTGRLSDIIVTALNIPKQERAIGYATATVKGSELTRAREANVALALEGRIAGLNISGVNGGPASSSRLLLRGATSMNAGPPLLILNGIPIDNTQRGSANEYGGADYGDGISNINPDDIETITVLKGSAGSALYGARAANGILIINTKTGAKNSRPAIDYNFNLSYDQAVNNTDYQYVYGQGQQNKRPSSVANAINSGIYSWGERLDGQPTIQFDGNYYPYSAVKNNASSFYRLAPALTNTIAINGGTGDLTYRLSASNLQHASILKNSDLNRKTINLNIGYDVTQKLAINFYGNYIHELNKNRAYLSDAPLNANYGINFLATSARQQSLAPGYDPTTGIETPWNDDVYKTNPYFVIAKQVDDASRNRFISATVVKYDISPDTYLQGRLGYDISKDHILNVVPTGTAFTVNQKGVLNGQYDTQITELNTDLLIATKRTVSPDVHLDLSAGGNFRRRNYSNEGYTGGQFIIPYVYTIANLASTSFTRNLQKLITESAYYTADLDYKKYLSISTTGRYDIYSTLPSGNRGIFVPAISGSFVFTELLHIPLLNYGKLRMSLAKTSGEPVQPYTTQLYYATNSSINGIPLGNFGRELPNQNLKPFTLNEFESGFNLVFLNNRLNLDFTYFHRITHNEITKAQQSVTTGFTSAYVNLGKTQNSGIEVSLNAALLEKKNFGWHANLNFSHVHNILLSIDGTSQYVLTGTYRPLNANTAMVVGKSITQIMAYDYRYDQQGNIIIGNDGIPLRGGLKAMGSTLPSDYGGISNTFRYKSFSLSFLIDFRFGNKVLSATENYSYVYGLNKATLAGREGGVVANGVLPDGSPNMINVAAYNYYPQLASNISALSVLNGGFIKFRQLILGYECKPRIFNHFFRSVSIDLVGRNLFTILKYTKNIDPESQFSPNLNYAGIEGASLPATRSLGLNLNFRF